jgi:hypothetical protein
MINFKNKTFVDCAKQLENKGYKNTHYSNNSQGQGVAYYETNASVLKLIYEWVKVGEDSYKSGKMIDIEDVTSCYI